MRKMWSVIALFLVVIGSAGCAPEEEMSSQIEPALASFIEEHVEKIRPIDIEANLAWWESATTGSKEAYQRQTDLKNKIDAIYNDREAFEQLKGWRSAEAVRDPILIRQLELLYREFLARQVDSSLLERMNAVSTEVEQTFATFRASMNGEEFTQNDLQEILANSTDSEELKAAWEGTKQVGQEVRDTLLELVELRNEAASALGFADYYDMQLFLNEQEEAAILGLFEQLDAMTREPFQQLKAELDVSLAERYRLAPEDLRPWHYQNPYFQEAPPVFGADLNRYYADGTDIADLGRRFFASIGLDPTAILERSSLYEEEGKNPHAFSTDIDRAGDVRVLLNIRPTERWMETMLHELGHAVYSSNIDGSLPWLLRTASHTLTTEGYAMMMGRLAKNVEWMKAMNLVEEPQAEEIDEAAWKMLRTQELVFSRWTQVMLHFERGLYDDPEQDLNRLWWDLKEKYQSLARPEGRDEPDYAAKIHIVSAPVYYHNYMMGSLFASQVHKAMVADVLGVEADPRSSHYGGNRAYGEWMVERIFEPGAKYGYNELLEQATGNPLNPADFAAEFVQ